MEIKKITIMRKLKNFMKEIKFFFTGYSDEEKKQKTFNKMKKNNKKLLNETLDDESQRWGSL